MAKVKPEGEFNTEVKAVALEPRPSIGRIVTYVEPVAGTDIIYERAAMITGVSDKEGVVDLMVFPPRSSPFPVSDVELGERESHYWRWPLYVPAKEIEASEPEDDQNPEDNEPPKE